MRDISENKEQPLETHPLEPFLPEGARLLMCGTFPPSRKRWSMDFYYPNFINDMWRIFGLIFFEDKDALVIAEQKTFRLNDIKELLIEKGIALSDTGKGVVRTRGNAADKFLEIHSPIDLVETLSQLPFCEAIATTGEKAAETLASITGTVAPKVGEYVEFENPYAEGKCRLIRHWRMPSSSRAYPLPLAKKAEVYHKMLSSLGMV